MLTCRFDCVSAPHPRTVSVPTEDPSKPSKTLLEIRKLAIVAMFADDVLLKRLALKGGNALDIVLGLGGRVSKDVDFSIQGDFEDLEDTKRRAEAAIRDRFAAAGYEVFDFQFEQKPVRRRPNMPVEWGGYDIMFKVIKKERLAEVDPHRPERKFTLAEDVGPGSEKTLTIQISHHEYTTGSVTRDLDHHRVVVYTPAMIAAEKLRAICQQMPEYKMYSNPAPRSGDFYDIQRICEVGGVKLNTPENRELLAHMFEAKLVPLELLDRIDGHRDFHEQNWPEVMSTSREKLTAADFHYYFDYVLRIVRELELPRNV